MSSLISFILGCFIHIILILIFEGGFLFVILFPLITRVANRFTSKFNKEIFKLMVNNGFGSKVNVTFTNKEDKELYADVPLNLLLQADINDSFYKRGDIIYSFKTPLDDIIKGCAVNEALYIKIHQYMPYIVYAILLFVLIVCCIIMVILAKIFNIHIHYLYILVNSIIIFALVVTYAFFVLYFTLTQPYVLNIDEKAYLALYDFVNS